MLQFRLPHCDQVSGLTTEAIARSPDMLDHNYTPLYDTIADSDLSPWLDRLPQQVQDSLTHSDNGHIPQWLGALNSMPDARPSRLELKSDAITIGQKSDLSPIQTSELRQNLMAFHPWRKGPWNYFGLEIDTEWRSEMKWNRLKQSISPLKDRLVLDVGCGNGYYSYRIAGEGAKLALGADPFLLYVFQSLLARHYLPTSCPAFVVPLGIEALPSDLPFFDTVLSMGVLYHRRSPLDHLLELKGLLREGGELVLETLVIDGDEGQALLPKGRYAKMRNTWFIPSCPTLERWLERCGFQNIRLANLSTTTTDEQRSTDWMTFDSLDTFLDPKDSSKTIEGYPAPKRAIFIANR